MTSEQAKLEYRKRLARAAGILGSDDTLMEAVRRALNVAPSEINVLILGARGTGKELFARLIHQNSGRRDNRFEDLNCAAIPEKLFESEMFGHKKGAFTGADANRAGRFELAGRGTLFLDELGRMPMPQQAGLLRVIQEGKCRPVGAKEDIEVRPRIVAATNVDLAEAVAKGELREDLVDRFGYRLTLPALCQRRADIPVLAQAFLEEFIQKSRVADNPCPRTLAPGALRRLEIHTWPGNIRELRATIESACVDAEGSEIKEGDLTINAPPSRGNSEIMPEPVPGFDLQGHLDRVREHCYRRAMELAGQNMSKAAELLGITRQAMKQWCDKQGSQGDKRPLHREMSKEK